jgi:hypothetical protein
MAGNTDAGTGDSDGEIIRINYRPRGQFAGFHNRAQRFACIVAHRRAGKTVACVHELQRAALRCEKTRPRFAYIAPFLRQAKTVSWDYLLDAIAPLREIGASAHLSELRVDYHNGGQVRLYGADNPDALRGIYLDGVVLDEYADMNPRLWSEVIRPALADRAGWAVFIGTPKGRNAFFETWQRALADPQTWFSLMLKVSETGLIAEDELALARKELTEEQYAQEFECSFDAAIIGAYYGKAMADAERGKRICGVPYDPAAQVWTAWDLGFRDATAIWFAQIVGKEVHLIDYHESVNVDITDDVRLVQSKPYNFAGHILPHDAWAAVKQTGKTTAQFMEGLGLRNLDRAPDHRVHDGITNAQVLIPRCWFDAVKCAHGIEALKLYRAEYDDKRRTLKPGPLHDWSSHAADAFRYLAVTLDHTKTRATFLRRIEYPSSGLI